MSTRATIVVYSSIHSDSPIVNIYKVGDGTPHELGSLLKKFLGQALIAKGLSAGAETPKQFNGMGCLAAWLVAQLKGNEIGNIYLMPLGAVDSKPNGFHGYYTQEYLYDIYQVGDRVGIRCFIGGYGRRKSKLIYGGLLEQWNPPLQYT